MACTEAGLSWMSASVALWMGWFPTARSAEESAAPVEAWLSPLAKLGLSRRAPVIVNCAAALYSRYGVDLSRLRPTNDQDSACGVCYGA
jgi:hypothetical protein